MTTSPGPEIPREREPLDAARNDDREQFDVVVEHHRRELRAHCYRMLGSYTDAEDALQEALLYAWRGLAQFGGRSSVRTWLYRITTNTCLRMIERRPRRILPADYMPPSQVRDGLADPITEPIWLEPYPDDTELGDATTGPEAHYEQRESVELAFVAALLHLPARQRAVLILRDVLGYSARETADLLDTTPVSVDSLLQRAHKTVDTRLPRSSQQQTLRRLGDKKLNEIVTRYVTAWQRHDIETVVSMLTEQAKLEMPPMPSWYTGRDQITEWLHRYALSDDKQWQLTPAAANGQPTLAGYLWDGRHREYTPYCLYVLTLQTHQIQAITAFVTPAIFPHFNLPESIAA
jgi:RNA polymerase sigma-70 factor (ECF subfamily)